MGRKHVKNRVYQRTERKIFNALASISRDKSLAEVQIRELTRVAKIAESTFYDHYRNLADLMNKNRAIFLKHLEDEVKTNFQLEMSMEQFYEKLFIFLYKENRLELMQMDFHKMMNLTLFRVEFKMLIYRFWNRYEPELMEAIYDHFLADLVAELYRWRREKYHKNFIVKHARNLVYLTKNAPKFYVNLA
jgi:transcriptional regulator